MMTHGFERLNPAKCEPLPKYMWMTFFDITFRARGILKGRSGREIKAICKVLNTISRSPGFENPSYEFFRNWQPVDITSPTGDKLSVMSSASDAGELLHNINRVKLEKIPNPPKALWHELFAVMALSFVDKAVWIEAEPNGGAWGLLNLPPRTQSSIEAELAQYAITGTEAVAVAESILRQDKALEAEFEQVTKKRKEVASKGGKAKGKKTEQLVAELIAFDRKQGPFKSAREAVTRFVASQPKHRFVHLTEPVEPLYRALLKKWKKRKA